MWQRAEIPKLHSHDLIRRMLYSINSDEIQKSQSLMMLKENCNENASDQEINLFNTSVGIEGKSLELEFVEMK